MLLNDEQLALLQGDLDYILARTKCNVIQLSKSQVLNAMRQDPDILLDLIEGLPTSEARWLSIPLDAIRPLIYKRARGGVGEHAAINTGYAELPISE